MQNKYHKVNLPPWGKVYYIVDLPGGGGGNLLWGKVYSTTPVFRYITSQKYKTIVDIKHCAHNTFLDQPSTGI